MLCRCIDVIGHYVKHTIDDDYNFMHVKMLLFESRSCWLNLSRMLHVERVSRVDLQCPKIQQIISSAIAAA